MDRKEILNKISDIVAERFNIDQALVTDNLNFKADLNADSIDFVEFIFDVENAFGDEVGKISTVGEVVDYVVARRKKLVLTTSATFTANLLTLRLK